MCPPPADLHRAAPDGSRGLVEAEEAARGAGATKRRYFLTDAGCEELLRWVAEVVEPPRERDAAYRMNLMPSSGQSCESTSPLMLHVDIADQVEARVAELKAAIRLGLPLEHSTDMGPLVSAQQYARVTELLDAGVQEGPDRWWAGAGLPT